MKEDSLPIIIQKNPNKIIDKNVQVEFNVGYLFLQDLYYKLGLNDICKDISDRHQFKFDLNDILSKLIYSRILFPASKLKTMQLSKKFFEQPNFEYQHVERTLPVLCEENDFIQSQLYNNSKKYSPRNNRILYYDCTNFFFEIEQEDGNTIVSLYKKGVKVVCEFETVEVEHETVNDGKPAKYQIGQIEEKDGKVVE